MGRERPSLDPRPPVKDYTLVGQSLQRAHFPTRHSDLAFTVRNRFDSDVRDPSDSAAALPSDIPLPGRTFLAELRLHW